MDSEKLIIELNYKNQIVDESRQPEPFSSHKMFDLLPETVAGKRTLQILEIHELFKAINYTRTSVGAARLFHSLVNPPESIELIHAKQDSFCEVESNDQLKKAIAQYLEVFRAGENDLFRLINAHLVPIAPYRAFNNAMKSIRKMLKAAEMIPRPETVYLDSLVQSILSFTSSSVNDLASGSRYRTFSGIKSGKSAKFWQAKLKFRSGRISGGVIWPSLPCLYFGSGWLFGFLDPGVAEAFFLITSWIGVLGIMYGGLVKPIFDYETAILPIRKKIVSSNRFASAIEAVAGLDELLSFVGYSKAVPHPTVIPEILNDDTHFFVARDLRNPILAVREENFVGNDVSLEGVRATFVTGPNSGGKTTYCKTIVQSQILGQIGAPVVASYARMNMADRITYQAPAFDSLNDPEGRFGTELKVTRDIFYSVTPKSLTVLDEIAEGTTTHEKMSLSVEIMNGFYASGGNTLLVTHSHELVEEFRVQNKGQYLQVEFQDELPTHKLKEGISCESHALRVAQKIGFSPEDMQRHLKERGYV
ncbi:MAG: hypothetical protein KKB30_05765 [Proteobacteria bacterium]|nr:hypothetical protein [Pseudomonadota bacterium]MBU1716206.1 hypothetical protein [Pseudomonadota bacterium]